ncbi:uncharacterized protein LOC130987656 isoform X1 [Salvia miltiorrhiza]|uniref:uncharacterized protein LOC130987656 isoform X1 n=1 Tax=Salvia miltiorrhiza TaxID=226208 RepID=UPI0025AC2520|nr:uncharacterized protein LOC130987656 isoform X1 [Salvia miltiorrhiza]
MANQGAKKRKEENIRHMKTLLRLIIASNVIYIVLRMGVFYSSFTWKHWLGLILTSLAYVIPYQQLDAMAKPSYTEDGELLDGGFDMSTGGICGYLHDVIYITCFVQLSSIISGKFWYIYLVVRHSIPSSSIIHHLIAEREREMHFTFLANNYMVMLFGLCIEQFKFPFFNKKITSPSWNN